MTLRRIDSVEELHRYLQAALQLEHSTLPPYLVALYSIRPSTNEDAARILHSVAVEEMLHMVLVANILNAVGGSPDLTVDGFIPAYPAHLPDGERDFEVRVGPFSRDAIATFLQIERPGVSASGDTHVERARSKRALLPAFVDVAHRTKHFFSIGEFYREIDRGLQWLDAHLASRGEHLFVGDPARQVTPSFRYSGGGEIIAVGDLASARAAIRLICEQGEGLGGAIYDEEDELSHYYRLEQIALGRYYQPGDSAGHPSGPTFDVEWDAVYPIPTDARLTTFPDDPILLADIHAFAHAYWAFLVHLTTALSGRPDLLDDAVGEMYDLKKRMIALFQTVLPDGAAAAPAFGGLA